jgi:MFS transporter, DHA3 family, multidrug efflux protein
VRIFKRLLVNSLMSGVTSTFLWFAVTFWVYIETKSVVATGAIGGAFALASAVFGVFFGTFVDRHRKKTVMLVSSSASLTCYAIAAAVYALVGSDDLLQLTNPAFWAFVFAILIGSVAGNLRGIALSTCVSLLVEESARDRANGLVGTMMGISFTITSVFSGLVIGQLGMGWALVFAIALTAVSILHLLPIPVSEADPRHANDHDDDGPKWFDVRGAWVAIRETPGLFGLVLFAAFNNLLGGVFMSLMDAYGLSLVSVEAWGLLFAGTSLGFIVGGLLVAKRGLGPRPMRVILIGNLANWTLCTLFTLRSSIVLMGLGSLMWMTLMPVIESAEQTVLQRAVPFEKQGRVFGFAQTIENAAAPLTSFLIGPIAEVIFMPYMTDGGGVDLIGSWFGVGPERGIALIFTLAGLLGIAATIVAGLSRSYRLLSAHTDDPSIVAGDDRTNEPTLSS